jgi:hypothetical protein
MITQAYIVSDLELRLSKSKPSSDMDLTYEQMAYWVDQARDAVTKAYVDQAKTIDSSLVMKLNELSPYEVGEDVFVDLGLIPLDIKGNRGVLYVEDDSGNFLHGSTSSNRKFLSKMAFTKASSCTVVYTLNGSSILIEGGSGGMNSTYNVGLVHAELSREKEPSDRYYVAPSTLQAILELAEEIGLRELNGDSYYDITNDGKGNDIK